MNQVEKILKQGLDEDPADWSVRLELAGKLADRSANDEVDRLLQEAPIAPVDESQAHRLVELANQCQSWDGLKHSLSLYSESQPNSSWGQFVYAQALFHTGDKAAASSRYQRAKEIDGKLSDPELETLLREQEAARIAADTASVPAARPLRPPGEEEKEDNSPTPPTRVLPDSGPIAVSAAPEEVAEAVHLEGEHIEHVDVGGADRAFIVGDGEMVHAHEKDPDAKEKVSAIAVAILVHVVVIILLGLIGLAMPRPKPPQITANAVANLDADMLEQDEIKKVKRAPVQTASAQMQVTTVAAASAVSMPEIDTNLTTFDPVGAGDNFGTSMSFDMGEDGGMVSFFGAKAVSKKVVFVVDYSASMNGDKNKLMRKELAKSIEALPNGVQYQLILFSGPAWYAGQETTRAKKFDDHIAHIVKDGREEYVWYEGWDKSQRHGGDKKSALYHYDKGEDPKDLPEGEYITATRSNLRKTLKHIEDTPLSFGTDWRWPLMMAINMQPDTIYFMTDGAFGTGKGFSKTEMIDEILDHNRRMGKSKINTVCMMVLNARTELEQLAEGTRGEFTLVLQDGTVVRGKELDKVGKKK